MKIEIKRNVFAMIFVSIVWFFVWLFAFPLFGPITDGYLSGLRALAIEKGRFVQFFLVSMGVSSFFFGYLADRTERRSLLIWVSTIGASLLTLSFVWLNRIGETFLYSSLLGIAAGVCPPAWGALFAEHISPEDRGRIMGISIGFSMPVAQLFWLAGPSGIGGAKTKLAVLSSLCLLTLLTILLRPREEAQAATPKGRRGPGAKQLLCYSVSMFLFYWVAGVLLSVVFPTIQDHVSREIFFLICAVPFLIGAVIGGTFLDAMGRNFPTIVGLAITGVSLAVFGVLGLRLGLACIFTLAIGYSLVTILSFVVWADLAPAGSRGVYYGAGSGLMTLAMVVGLFSTGTLFGSISASRIQGYMLYSSVALFLCIPPLILADEVLPRELIEKRRFQQYLEQAKRK